MKPKILFTLLFLSIAVNGNAQKSDLIAGNQVFKQALNKDIDAAGLAFVKAEVIDKWKLTFNSNGEFETSMMGEKATGKWKLGSDSNSIIISILEEEPTEFKILKSTDEVLALKLGLGEFLLKRIE